MKQYALFTVLSAVGIMGLGCSASSDSSVFNNEDTSGTTTGAGGGTTATTGAGGGSDTTTDTFNTTGSTTSTSSGTNCNAGNDEDYDADGYTINDGDCNDCDANVNPNAVEVISDDPEVEPADEDCDDIIDNVMDTCDSDIAIDESDAATAALAVDLCKTSTGSGDWGISSAEWSLPDGSSAPGSTKYALGHGVLESFGYNITPQAGDKFLVLSSGTARQPTDSGYQSVGGYDKGYTSGSPDGFPKESPACGSVKTGTPHDGVALNVTIQAPSNAYGFSFDFDFYTYEWPGYICSTFNDFFVALMDPIPDGQDDGNISFDSEGNPVSVNNAFLEVCGCSGGPPCEAGGKTFTCPYGVDELLGTGFDYSSGSYHGATSWLRTTAPIEPGSEFTLRWTVYDSGDGVLDSTTIVDNFQWVAEAGTVVGTGQINPPN